jgi:hypothetical protein
MTCSRALRSCALRPSLAPRDWRLVTGRLFVGSRNISGLILKRPCCRFWLVAAPAFGRVSLQRLHTAHTVSVTTVTPYYKPFEYRNPYLIFTGVRGETFHHHFQRPRAPRKGQPMKAGPWMQSTCDAIGHFSETEFVTCKEYFKDERVNLPIRTGMPRITITGRLNCEICPRAPCFQLVDIARSTSCVPPLGELAGVGRGPFFHAPQSCA